MMKVTNSVQHRQSKRAPFWGAGIILLAAALFSVMSVGIRSGRGDFRADNLVFYRSVISALCLFPWFRSYLRSDEGSAYTRFRFHFFRGLFGILSMVALFSSLHRLPLALATLLAMTGVAWSALFSWRFLGEKLLPAQMGAQVVVCVGLFLVVLPVSGGSLWAQDGVGILLGLLGGVCMGAAHTFIRKMRSVDTTTREIVFFFGVSGCLLTLPGFLAHPEIPQSGTQWRTLFLVCVIGSVAQMLMTWGFKYAKTATASLLILQQTPLNVILGMWLLEETPPALFFVGLCLAMLGLFGVVRFAHSAKGA